MFGAPGELDYSPHVVAHAIVAMLCLVAGGVALVLRKGSAAHVWTGRSYVAMMVFVAVSSFWIGEHWSWIHGLSVWILISLASAILGTRVLRGPNGLRTHRNFMIGAYVGLWIAAVPAMTTPGRLAASWLGF